MILPLLPLFAQAKTQAIAPPPAEVARVRAFVTFARARLYPDAVTDEKGGVVQAVEEPHYDTTITGSDGLGANGIRLYRYDQVDVCLLPATGQIVGYSDSDRSGEPNYGPNDEIEPRKVTDEEAVALARRAYAAAGWAGEIAARSVYDLRGPNDQDLEVHYLPAAGGVPYDYGYEELIEVNRRTGRLDQLSVEPDIPLPPPSTVPRGSLAQARLIALRYGSELRGEALTERPDIPLALRIWYPTSGGMWTFAPPLAQRGYGPRARAALRNHQGVLAYVGCLCGGSWQSGVVLAIDAATGEVLDRADPEPPGASGGAGGFRPDPSEVAVPPTSARPWRVATGGAGWRAWSAPVNATLTPVAARPPAGTRVTLTDGRAAFPASYDARANLLAISGRAYRPGSALAALLKRRK